MSDQDASEATAVEDESTTDEGAAEDDAAEDGEADADDGNDAPAGEEFPLDDVDTDAADTDVEVEFDGVPEELVERVEESDPRSVAHELAALRERVEALESQLDAREEELDDVTSKLKRKQADFQNYKKRMEKRREQERQRATEDLVERLTDVRDNLVRALDQDGSGEEIRGGVESTLRQFDRVLEEENVTVVDPDPGEEVDPQRHEVLMRVESDEPEDAIAGVHRPGYVMAEKVLQTAQVTVSDGSLADDDAADTETDGDGDTHGADAAESEETDGETAADDADETA